MSQVVTRSSLQRLRALVPQRPLSQREALTIAELQANRLLEWSGITDPGTPEELIADLPFVRVVQRHDLPASGSAQWFKPRWLILLNGNEPTVRQRFSLMHEFKHVLDHPFVEFLYPAIGDMHKDRRGELIADYFAACLLMPKRLVKLAFGQGLHEPLALAELFNVSEVAMRYRLQQLGLTERVQRCNPVSRRTDGLSVYFRSRQPVLTGVGV